MNIPYTAITPFEPLGIPNANAMTVKRITDHIEAWFLRTVHKHRDFAKSRSGKFSLATSIRIALRDIPKAYGATNTSSIVDVKQSSDQLTLHGFTYRVMFTVNGKEYTCIVEQHFTTHSHWSYP